MRNGSKALTTDKRYLLLLSTLLDIDKYTEIK